jgi:hypothetical protein
MRPQLGDVLYIQNPDGSKRFAVFVGRENANYRIAKEKWDFDCVIERHEDGRIWLTRLENFEADGVVNNEGIPVPEKFRFVWAHFAAAWLAETEQFARLSSADFVYWLKKRALQLIEK